MVRLANKWPDNKIELNSQVLAFVLNSNPNLVYHDTFLTILTYFILYILVCSFLLISLKAFYVLMGNLFGLSVCRCVCFTFCLCPKELTDIFPSLFNLTLAQSWLSVFLLLVNSAWPVLLCFHIFSFNKWMHI